MSHVFPSRALRIPRRAGFLLFAALLGCNPSGAAPGSYDLEGNIDYQGNPIPAGSITFMPDNDAGNKGPAAIAEIKDGRYKTAPGRGVLGGAYILRITAHDGKPVPVPDADPSEGPVSAPTPLFPPDSEMKVTLPAGQKTFDLKVEVTPPPAPRTGPATD
jgi:hypothetical protein